VVYPSGYPIVEELLIMRRVLSASFVQECAECAGLGGYSPGVVREC